MTKHEYMMTLSQNLRRLPKEDYTKALAYFEEYFEDAGVENEQQAIADLGSPDIVANELIMDLAMKNTLEPPKTVKRGLSAVWIGLLGVCAAPIALPLVLVIFAVFLALMITVFACIFSLLLAAVGTAACGLVGSIAGCILLFSSFPDGLATIGVSLCSLGIGCASVYASGLFCRWFLKKISKLLGQITKGGKKHEITQ